MNLLLLGVLLGGLVTGLVTAKRRPHVAAAAMAVAVVAAVVLGTVWPSHFSTALGLIYGVLLSNSWRLAKERRELDALRKDGEPANEVSPNEVPFRIVFLTQKANEGDVGAVALLWEAIYDEPLDPDRPAGEIAQEIEVGIAAKYGSDGGTDR